MFRTKGLKIAVFDAETDPFLANRVPKPFTCGFYDGSLYLAKWGKNCIAELLHEISDLGDDYLIYVHNGGKFDFWFFMDWIDDQAPITIINGRLVEFRMKGTEHVFRDSLAIIPVPLSAYQKSIVDYNIFEREKRNIPANRLRIETYLKSDCINLWELVSKFSGRFEDKRGNLPISIGQASIRELQARHDFEILSEASDKAMRPFYMGGRVQCFAAGILKGPFKVYDVNGMYSKVMKDCQHPLQDAWEILDRPPKGKGVWFAEFEGTNRQALPMALEGGLSFSVETGTFLACSHELRPAMENGMVTVDKWIQVLKPMKSGTFGKFVDHWQNEKVSAEQAGDKAGKLFAKLVLNSAYGKTGQQPESFKDYKILRDIMHDDGLKAEGYEPDVRISDHPFIEIWSRKAETHGRGYYNVSIAASVTSAARALLLESLSRSVAPIYCDTDSIICRGFRGDIHPSKLGSWKLEAVADYAAIAGKKLYCLYNQDGRKITPVKWASKGGDLDPLDIIRIAKGETVKFVNQVPTYSLSRGIDFITRNFRKTVENPKAFDHTLKIAKRQKR